MIAILVADDHVVVRSGVRSLLRDDPNMRIAAEARTAAEVLQQVGTRHFDVVLLDIRLPDGDGVDLIPKVRKRAPTTRIVMFTNAEEEVRRALDAGAIGFLSKDALVHSHRGRMLKKLGVSDMRELMLYAMRNGLTDWAPLEINAD